MLGAKEPRGGIEGDADRRQNHRGNTPWVGPLKGYLDISPPMLFWLSTKFPHRDIAFVMQD
jgi:hypothetical protein